MSNESIFQLNVTGPKGFRQQFRIPEGITTIGRQSGNTLQLNHSRVSRKHAILRCTSDECAVTDLGSSNGTHVNGERLVAEVPVQLSHGATIEISPFVLTFEQIPVERRLEELPPPVKKSSAEASMKISSEKAPSARRPERETELEIAAMKSPREHAVPPPPRFPKEVILFGESPFAPGIFTHSQRLLRYLPRIYHTDFMGRFLAIFEAIMTPIEWTVDNFDFFLDPLTAPTDFLPWLANWFNITFDSTWSDEQRRTLLSEAHQIYARRGTKWALSRVLEIYTGQEPEIDDTDEKLEAFTFTVKLPVRKSDVSQKIIESIIDANKPAHTIYTLKFDYQE